MAAAASLTSLPMINPTTGGLSIDGNNITSDGVNGTLTVVKTVAASGLSITAGGSTITAGNLSLTAGSIAAPSGTLSVGSGLSVTAGGQTITAGGQSITAGGQTITAGGSSITAGGLTVTAGGASLNAVSGGVAAVQTVATGGTIAVTAARVLKCTVAAGATASNLSLGSGLAGQEVMVINENATGGSTLGITGTVNAAMSISGLKAQKFVFDDTQTAWCPC